MTTDSFGGAITAALSRLRRAGLRPIKFSASDYKPQRWYLDGEILSSEQLIQEGSRHGQHAGSDD